jgi:hypothetical protein
MSIPLSLDARISRGESKAKIWWHVVVRTLSLLALGLFIANARQVHAQSMHISQECWTVLGLVAMALAFVRFPSANKRRVLHRTMRIVGLSMIVALFAVFRRVTPEGYTAGLDFSYWEILGLLGWVYFLASTIYLLFAKRPRILLIAYLTLVALNAASILGWLRMLGAIPFYWNPFEAGLSSLTTCGVLASFIIIRNSYVSTFEQKTRWILAAAAMLFALGLALQPLGISKNHDTPTWCLYCTAANLLFALLLLWLADRKGWKVWAKFVTPAGENPLFPYMLAYIPFLLPPLYWLTPIGTHGSWGVLKSALLTALVLAASSLLMRRGLRLRV